MPPDIQVKLLRALESRSVRRLGGKKEIAVDIRIVAATNKDVQKAMLDGELREDLYYRLGVVEFVLPPLRERGGDIVLLAETFLARFSKQNGKRLQGFEDGALAWLAGYNWPGNVRELKNAVERAVILARGKVVTATDLAPRHLKVTGEHTIPPVTLAVGASLADARRQLALRTLAQFNGDVARTASVLGLDAAQVRDAVLSVFAPLDEGPAPTPAVEDDPGDRAPVRLVRSIE